MFGAFGAPVSARSGDETIWAGGPWSYPGYYSNYDPYYDELHTQKNFRAFWGNPNVSEPPRPIVTGSPLPPPRPATPVMHEYSWPEQANSSAAFSIVTTTGTEYLATMVWVQDGVVNFTSVDGAIRQMPLASISRPLTRTANARKNLNLPLPPVEVTQAIAANGEIAKGDAKPPSKGN
jgi:hypothetical protein